MRLEQVIAGKLTSFEDLLELQEDCHIVEWFLVNAGVFVVMTPAMKAAFEKRGLPWPPQET